MSWLLQNNDQYGGNIFSFYLPSHWFALYLDSSINNISMLLDDGPTLLLPCIVCNKTFKPEVLQRHSKVCEKNTNKKRKTFDSFKQRVKGTDLAEFLPFSSLQKRASVSEKTPSPKKNSSRWKENHEAFVSAIRAARGISNRFHHFL